MNLTLGKEDARAVDLLLDRSARAAGGERGKGHAVFAMADVSLGQRIARAQHLLQLLELFPGTEPPSDLVVRTLRFVEESSRGSGDVRTLVPHLINTERPLA